ncbi:hypothetical protein GX865_04150 [Candidatus Saccharibacteria bacterium]|jgi:hypothetical protein|nr:hypothetical protein [Candidatus Saccharibacteria bacterium]
MEKASINENRSISGHKKAVIAAMSGVLAIAGCSSTEGKPGMSGIFGDGGVPVGMDCVNHPENWQIETHSIDERGTVVQYKNSFELFADGDYGPDGSTSDELINHALGVAEVLSRDYGNVSADPDSRELLREGYRELLNADFHNPRALNDQDIPHVRLHLYGDGGAPERGQSGEYKVCVAWNDIGDEDMKHNREHTTFN